ncbi:CHASE2 domain-containing protein [Planctomycetota bacterium]
MAESPLDSAMAPPADRVAPGTVLSFALLSALLTLPTIYLLQPNDMAFYDEMSRSDSDRNAADRQHPHLTLLEMGHRVRDRTEIARVVDLLVAAEARAIGLEMLLDEPSLEPGADEALEEAIRRAHDAGVPVILNAERWQSGKARSGYLRGPRQPFVDAGGVVGVANLLRDRNNAVREAPAFVQQGAERILGFAVLLAGYGAGSVSFVDQGTTLCVGPADGGERIGLQQRGSQDGVLWATYPIHFVPGRDAVRTIGLESLDQSLDKAASDPDLMGVLGALVLGSAVKDKVLLVGQGNLDRNEVLLYAPSLLAEPYTPRVVVQAHALRTLLDGSPPTYPTAAERMMLTLAVALVATMGYTLLRAPRSALMLLIAALVSSAVLTTKLVGWANVYVPLPNVGGALIFAFGADIWRRLRAERRGILRYFAAATRSGFERLSALDDKERTCLEAALPHPIAAVRASARAFPPGPKRLERLLDLIQATVRMLASVAVADAARMGGSDPLRHLLGTHLERPSLGHFVMMLDEGCAVVGRRPLEAVVPELAALFGSEHAMHRWIDRLVRLHDQLHSQRTGVATGDCDTVAHTLEADMDAFLAHLSFFRDYPLARLVSTYRTPEGLTASVHLMTGPNDSHPHTEIVVREDPPRDAVIIVSRRTHAVLDLAPLVTVLQCRRHSQEEVAFLNGVASSADPHYLSFVHGCAAKELTVPQGAAAAVERLRRRPRT